MEQARWLLVLQPLVVAEAGTGAVVAVAAVFAAAAAVLEVAVVEELQEPATAPRETVVHQPVSMGAEQEMQEQQATPQAVSVLVPEQQAQAVQPWPPPRPQRQPFAGCQWPLFGRPQSWRVRSGIAYPAC